MADDLPPDLDDFEDALQQNREKDSQKNAEFIGDYTLTREEEFKSSINTKSPATTQKQAGERQSKVKTEEEFLKGMKTGFLLKDDESKQNKEDIEEIKSNPNEKKNDKVISEVQDAMKMKNYLQENQTQWVNDDLLKEISGNEKLQKLFGNKEYLNAFAMMEKDPQKVMETYGKNPEFLMLYQEFCKCMGQHFQKLEQETSQATTPTTALLQPAPTKNQPQIQQIPTSSPAPQQNSSIPSASLGSSQSSSSSSSFSNPSSQSPSISPVPGETPEQKSLREQIESDQEVQLILSDPKVMNFIQYLQSGRALDFHQVMRSDQILGKKIMILIQKGVLNISSAPPAPK